MNNYEKIKQMSVDEMAEWFLKNLEPLKCEFCKEWSAKSGDYVYCLHDDCEDGIKQYLLQEVEE